MAQLINTLTTRNRCFQDWNLWHFDCVQLLCNIRDRLIGAGQIRFVDDDNIGDLEDAGFFPLQLVAGLRLDDEHNGVGHPPDRRIGLAGADGFNKDTVKPQMISSGRA